MVLFSCKGTPNPKFENGRLGECPDKPNCVNSQTGEGSHKVAPLSASLAEVVKVITSMKRVKVIEQTTEYVYAEFSTAIIGYVDDVEFYENPNEQGLVQVRSASRVGHSDFGANRKRVELIRGKLNQ